VKVLAAPSFLDIPAISRCVVGVVVAVSLVGLSSLALALMGFADGGAITEVEPDGVIGLGWLEDAELNPAGVLLATCSNWAIQIWGLNGTCIFTIPARSVPWVSVSWSPHGTMLAGADSQGQIHIYSIPDGCEVAQTTYTHESYRVTCPPTTIGPRPLEWSPDGSLLAHGWIAGNIELHDPSTGNHVATLREEGYETEVAELAWSPDGKLVAAAVIAPSLGDTTVLVYSISELKSLCRLGCNHTYPEAPVSFSTEGTLALAAGNGLVRIHDGQDGGVLLSADLSTRVTALAWSPEGDALAVGSWEGEIIILSRELVEVARVWSSRGYGIASLSWEGERIASVSSDQTVRTWWLDQSKSVRLMRVFSGWGSAVSDVRWYPDEIHILACHYGIPRTYGYDAGSVRCYGADGEERFRIEEVSGFKAADLSPDGKMIATVTYQGEVAVWDAAFGWLAARIDTSFARSCRWSPARPGLLAVFGYNGLGVWDVANLTSPILSIQEPDIVAVDWAGNGELLALGRISCVEVWDVTRPALLASVQTWSYVSCVAFSPDGSVLACLEGYNRQLDGDVLPEICRFWCSVAKVTVWMVDPSGPGITLDVLGEVHLPRMFFWRTTSLAWSPDSAFLAVAKGTPERVPLGGEECGPPEPGILVMQVDARSGLNSVLNLTGPTRPTSSVDWSPMGGRIVAGSDDGTVMTWAVTVSEPAFLLPILLLIPTLRVLRRQKTQGSGAHEPTGPAVLQRRVAGRKGHWSRRTEVSGLTVHLLRRLPNPLTLRFEGTQARGLDPISVRMETCNIPPH